MISIIHPSRGRAMKSLQTTSKWVELADKYAEVELLVSIDEDEPQMNLYQAYPNLIINKNRSAVDAINNAAKVAKGNILIVVSDDTFCPVDWNLFIDNETHGKTDWILKTQDGIQPWIITMPIMDRVYYNRFGYIYHPDYKHLFCDTELTCVADITGRKITSNLLFPHNHYSIGKSVKDEVSIRADATQAEGEKLFIERYKKNFDLPPGNKIQDKGLIDWLLKRNVHA